MTSGCSANVVERHAARQTTRPLVREPVPQRGRLADSVANPNSCLGDQLADQPVSARKGRSSRQFTPMEYGRVNQLRPNIGIDVSQATLDLAISPSGEQWQHTNDTSGIAQLVERLRTLQPER